MDMVSLLMLRTRIAENKEAPRRWLRSNTRLTRTADSGIISTTLGQKTFPTYFNNPSANLTGAIVSTYSGGQGVGNLLGGWLGDALGRKKTIWLASTLALIGAILQTTAVKIEYFLVGRIIAGFSVGLVYAVSSIYNAGERPPVSFTISLF